MVRIILKNKEQVHINYINKVLKTYGIPKQYHFYSENDIKKEFDYYLKHKGDNFPVWFPKDLKSFDDFKLEWNTEKLGEIFCPSYGTLMFDPYFNRTSQNIMKLIGTWLYSHTSIIEECSGSYDTFIERCGCDDYQIEVISKLSTPNKEPELLPENERTTRSLQSGLWLCKSWSNKPFWVLYGNVKSPRFMKDRQYKDDLYNNLYLDDNNYAFLLLPLMPLDANTAWFYKIYDNAVDLGLREHPNFIIPLVYGISFTKTDGIDKDFKEWYTQEEILERFKNLAKYMVKSFNYNIVNGFVWKGDKFEPCSSNPLKKIEGLVIVLNSLYYALDKKPTIKHDYYELKIS